MTKVIAVVVDYKSKITKAGVETIVVDNNKNNRGFAGGVNIGIKKALSKKADKILLLNPDIKITTKQIQAISEGKTDIVSPVLKFNRLGKEVLDYGGKINYILGRTTHNENKVGKIDYVSGACMLIDKKVFQRIGLFDPKFFMYFEDVDFCLRAKKAGFKISVDEETVVEHQISEHRLTSDEQKQNYLLNSNKYFIKKWIPWFFKPTAYIYFIFLWLKTNI